MIPLASSPCPGLLRKTRTRRQVCSDILLGKKGNARIFGPPSKPRDIQQYFASFRLDIPYLLPPCRRCGAPPWHTNTPISLSLSFSCLLLQIVSPGCHRRSGSPSTPCSNSLISLGRGRKYLNGQRVAAAAACDRNE